MEFRNLDAVTREHMLSEIQHDIEAGTLYTGKRLTDQGAGAWPNMLKQAAENGDDTSLSVEVQKYIAPYEVRNMKSGPKQVRTPNNAHEMLAQGEFNRFYIRAVCQRAIANGDREVQIYRARPSSRPRPESEARLGARCDANELLEDLRANPGGETVLQVPGGPNSGISVELIN